MIRLARKLLTPVLLVLVIGMMFQFNTFHMMENTYYDQMTREVRAADSQIAVIGVDETSLENMGRWPWPRSMHADLVDRLTEAGAKGIFLDLLFSEPSEDSAEDERMQQAIQDRPHVIIPSAFLFEERQDVENGLQYKSILAPIYSLTEEQHAHINVLPDRGEVVRQILLGVPIEGQTLMPAVDVRMANMLLTPDQQISYADGVWKRGDQALVTNGRNQVYFSYAQLPGEFGPVSYFDVYNMDPDAMRAYFQDKLVLIGPYSLSLGDQYLTPMSSTTKMYGVEIHANMIQALVEGAFYTVAEGESGWIGWLIIALLITVPYWLMQRLSAKGSFFLFAGLMIGYTLFVIGVFVYGKLLLPFTYPTMAIVSVYVWSVVSRYVSERRERNRVTSLFSRYVSQQVVDELLASEAAQSLGGTRKHVSIMFVDIRGFTTLSEQIEPEEVIGVLNEYLDLGTRAVFAHEGTLDKFIGDGIMSIFGAPHTIENHAEMAVRAALAMKRGSAELAERLNQTYGYSVSFGIGINTGDAVIGNIGSKNRLDYTAIGDTVNMAARLESNSKAGQILISQSTYDLVKDLFEIEELGEIKVKGKEKPVMVYQVQGEK
ncbi:CHASE2 domain-containing protein [Brevibacillus dissolubilis]|uniref:CHASE2 domain-containing protein n=1 Tax=Brevibacillus dissolubilis TaxID=1844116 RepID=UPI0011163A70|nr:adenylate/guanylate cyclase domain-containing protein [Brevibacillus dissolubilis]